jgi:hypothetical protein
MYVFVRTSEELVLTRILRVVWANDPQFLSHEWDLETAPGFDPLIGQTSNPDAKREMTGLHQNDLSQPSILPDFVQSRGGEYFFIPSIKCVREVFGTA